PRRVDAFWRSWSGRHRPGSRTGPDRSSQPSWAMCTSSGSGVSFVPRRSTSPDKSWCEGNDPEFATKAADVVGLYLAPPENAIVICVDEKPSIQALERAQGYLKLPNGRALTGHSHDYKR